MRIVSSMSDNNAWFYEKDGRWALENEWVAGSFIEGHVLAENVPVPVGAQSYVRLAEALCTALCKYPGAWLEDGTFSFVYQKHTVVVLRVHVATRTIDASWLNSSSDTGWCGQDGIDFSSEVAAAENTVRSAAL